MRERQLLHDGQTCPRLDAGQKCVAVQGVWCQEPGGIVGLPFLHLVMYWNEFQSLHLGKSEFPNYIGYMEDREITRIGGYPMYQGVPVSERVYPTYEDYRRELRIDGIREVWGF